MAERPGTIVVTGYPGFIGKRLVHRLARQARRERLVLLVLPEFAAAARADLLALGARDAEVWEGDVVRMHLGLSGPEFKELLRDATEIWHLAALSHLDAEPGAIRRVNVEGTRNVLDLARGARRLSRLHHFSTAFVSGDRQGVILEDELEMGQRFRNAYEESKARAEVLVRRAMAEIPATVYRPSIVVGDSRTGEIDRFDGPYYLAILLVTSPLAVPLPLPGDGVAPLNVVPVDYVVSAALAIGRKAASAGKTVHVVDPAPFSARRVYEMIAARAHKRLPPVSIPHRLVESVLSLPLLERFSRQQRAAIGSVNHLAFYNPLNQLALLEGTGVRCPPITSYLDRLIAFVKREFEKRHQAETDAAVEDPFDAPAPSPSADSPRPSRTAGGRTMEGRPR
jgi:nucleoside-diphosphate-sugar epimerase